ncbi:hypothetical protein U6A24_18270 [Aquimarina gracilis]|uniref:Uncharacterized protein n=1 Tax=Aquimarina gracilis TaxID=874422 RepID=A0ABU5ZZV3_9FLAO|nr:hypothetical protein [Aquimarina gracilis]MEB3347427.1 hypothetical protein [Aquimarina gracilis]
MRKFNRINIEFGIPENGWLFTKFQWEDFRLEMDLSNVPADPIAQLCDALIEINSGMRIPIRILWSLESYHYYFQLEQKKDIYKVIIFKSDTIQSRPLEVVKEFEGDYDQIILPLYRAVKKFNSYSYSKPHWEEMDSKRILKLTNLIKREHLDEFKNLNN